MSTCSRRMPHYGQPANVSFPLTQASSWFQCQAGNDIGVQSSPLALVPPGERAPWFPEGQLALLGRWVGGAKSKEGHWEAGMPTLALPASLTGQLPKGPTFDLRAGCQPHLPHSYHLRDAGLDRVDQVGSGCWKQGRGERCWQPVWTNRGPGWRAECAGLVGRGCHQGKERAVLLVRGLQRFMKGLLCATCLLRAC